MTAIIDYDAGNLRSVEKALEEYTGLNPSEPLFGRVLDVYRALGIGKKN